MIPRPLLGALLGSGVAAAVMLILHGLTAAHDRPPLHNTPNNRGRLATESVDPRRLALAVAIGLVVGVITRWVALGLLVGAATWIVPAARASRRAAASDRQRLGAVAGWIETIRDLLGSAAGIEEAIVTSAELAPAPIAPQVQRLRVATESGGLRDALVAFGVDMADPITDQVVWALMIASERSSSSVGEVLSQAARNTRNLVMLRQRVEASRARIYAVVNTIAVVTIGLGGFLIATQDSYVSWYGTSAGQVVLLVAGGLQLGGVAWMANLARHTTGYRLPVSVTAGSVA